MAIHHDIKKALHSAARRRHRDTLLRKEAQNNSLGARGYHSMQKELNNTKFLQPLDADTTKANIYYIRRRFLRRKRTKKKTVNQYWRDFKMLYRRRNKGRVYINGTLKDKFKLDDQPKNKPVMGVDDHLLGLTQHWSRDRSVFPTEDDRLDLSTIMLFQAFTACRPVELVDGTKSRAGKDPMLDDPVVEDGTTAKSGAGHVSVLSNEARTANVRNGTCRPKTQTGEEEAARSDSESESEMESDDAPFDDADDDSDEPVRKHKALCYEDIVL
ncbi:hypothetical protein TOPH_06522 [Tolypocladium ophioglossoides CBS 100239]|uniref:Uncharacterized protein n=1 Tax=Tolypocladium ophioglossoides (strain CBS 100239) TaxID=1163406 RepID=A0A0L0N3W6_TOLOC|nr:hypothetical protein TOPH_06522 [Tolypocladium ophioglossoides CBS 100239]